MSDLKYWLGFNLVKGIGPAKVQALLDYYGSLANAWRANEFELQKIGLDRRAIQTFLETRQEVDLDVALARVEQASVSLPLLYYQGELREQDQWAVAVVGTRRLTSYGRQVTQDLVAGLVQNNITVVSGLARGIDAIAHKTAVELGGRTLAVLGSGLDCVYPAENRTLAQEIAQGQGAIISEYGRGVQPEAKNFPPRNLIISGLSWGLIIV